MVQSAIRHRTLTTQLSGRCVNVLRICDDSTVVFRIVAGERAGGVICGLVLHDWRVYLHDCDTLSERYYTFYFHYCFILMVK